MLRSISLFLDNLKNIIKSLVSKPTCNISSQIIYNIVQLLRLSFILYMFVSVCEWLNSLAKIELFLIFCNQKHLEGIHMDYLKAY